MLEINEQNYFEGLLLKKMRETVDRDIAMESFKTDEYMNHPDPLDQAVLDHNRHMTIMLLEKKI
jgi:hypothetical protein